MRMLRQDCLQITDPASVASLLADLAEARKPLIADAAEILPNSVVWIKNVKDQYFAVETEYPPNDILAVPLSSWRIFIMLEGASLSLTTVSLARLDAFAFGLAIPDAIVSGPGRRHYRVSPQKSEGLQVSLLQQNRTIQAEIVEASFSDLEARVAKPAEVPLEAEHKVILAGRHHGVLFKEPAKVTWRYNDVLGIELADDEFLQPYEERSWSHVVRRMAYDQFMKHLKTAA